jgi:hypothetical protein
MKLRASIVVAAIFSLAAPGALGVAGASGTWTQDASLSTPDGNLRSVTAPCETNLSANCIYALGGRTESDNGLTSVYMYAPKSKKWSSVAAMPVGRADAGATTGPCTAATTRTCIYMVGGTDVSGVFLTRLDEYDPSSNSWTNLPNLPTPGAPAQFPGRSQLTAATAHCFNNAAQSCVYAIGGYNPALYNLSSVQMFNPTTQKWTTAASLQTARASSASTAAPCANDVKQTCLYAVGGTGTSGFLNSVEMYSPRTNTWQYVASLSDKTQQLGATAAPCSGGSGTCVYAYGGLDGSFNLLNTTVMFQPSNDTWSASSVVLQTARDSFGSTTGPCSHGSGKCLYAVGGSGQTYTPSVEENPA